MTLVTVTSRPTSVAVVPDAGTIDWTNISGALVSGGAMATATGVAPDHPDDAAVTHMLKFLGFGGLDEIPDAAELVSWKYRMRRVSDDPLGSHFSLIYRLENGSFVHPYSVPSVWGLSLDWEEQISSLSMPTVATLKAANSGLGVTVEFYGGDGVSVVNAFIDAVECVFVFDVPVVDYFAVRSVQSVGGISIQGSSISILGVSKQSIQGVDP